MKGGNEIKVFDTDCGKGLVICYDVEFPELPRILADQDENFVCAYLTILRMRISEEIHQRAKAIENEMLLPVV
jgi:predicted amidohydrolase